MVERQFGDASLPLQEKEIAVAGLSALDEVKKNFDLITKVEPVVQTVQ